MFKSKRLDIHQNNPSYLLKDIVKSGSFTHRISNSEVLVSYKIDNKKLVDFAFSAEEFNIALVDSLLTLILGREVDDLRSIKMKEFDYYLRDDQEVPLFSHYPDSFLQVIELPELMYQNWMSSQTKYYYNKDEFGEFSDLPYGEQIEVVEEVLSKILMIKEHEFTYNEIEINYPKIVLGFKDEKLKKLLKHHFQDNEIDLL